MPEFWNMRVPRAHRLVSRKNFRRTTIATGLTSVLMVSGFGYAGLAFGVSTVTADDSRATVVQGNINACPAGEPTLVGSNTGNASQNGITVTVSKLATSQANPFPVPGGPTVLPAGTQVVNITLPPGTTLNGDTFVKGGSGYNDYPGQYTVNLIPPVNNGGQIAGLSHFIICGTLVQTTGSINVKKIVSGTGPGSNGPFKVEVKCGATIDQTLSLTAGQNLTVDNIPDGTQCTVTETDASGADTTTYTVNGGAPSGSAPTFTVHAGDLDHVVVTNTYTPGSLRVTKTVVDHGTAPAGATYPVSVSCPGVAGSPFTFSLGDGDHHDISPLDPGTQCTVTETNSRGGTITYTVGATTGSSPPTVTVTAGNQSEVDITNTFPAAPPAAGTIHLAKTLTLQPIGVDSNTQFTFSLDCGAGVQTFTVTSGAPIDIPNVPAGVNCTLTETDAHGAHTTTFTVGGGAPTTGTSSPVTVTNGGVTNVTVNNAWQTAELDVTKDITGTLPPAGPFTVVVSCPGAPGSPFTLNLTAANPTGSVTGLPGGVNCTVTETDPDGATTTTYVPNGGTSATPPTVSLAPGDNKSVVITNDYAPAVLQVTKVTTGTTPPAGPFHVQVVCTSAGTFDFDINANQTHTINTIANDTCTVTETNSDGATSTSYTVNAGAPGSTPPSVPVSRGNTDTVTITNNFPVVAPVGSLTVNKIVNGTGAGHNGPFTVTADCGADGTFIFSGLVDGSSQTKQVPAGASCTVTETDANGATTVTYQVNSGSTSTTGPTVGITNGGTTTVTVRNSFPVTPPPAKTGALHIHKKVNKTKARYGQNLTYTLHVSASGQIDEHNVKVTDVVPAHTTFVSASCDAPCSTSGPTAGGVVTWNVGTIKSGDSVNLTMVVNITTPPENPADRQPETIPNAAVAASDENTNVPSNKVHTRVTVVQPEKVVRHPHKPTTSGTTLPFTGFDAREWGLAAILLVTIGAGMNIVARRRSVFVSPPDKGHYPTQHG